MIAIKHVKEKRFELIIEVFNKINFEKVLIPEEYSKDTFDDFLKWKIGTSLGMRYDKQLTLIYSQKSEKLQESLLKNLTYDFKQEQFEILSNIYFEFGK
ncbi:MAG: hypothetical protein ACRC0V_08600, partial [Fusobacteriaceae bacterium]